METILGIVGGSGLYQLPGVSVLNEIHIPTPFGDPSSPVTEAKIGETRVFFIARHGRNHQFLPSEVNYRANIFALKTCGVKWCVGVSAIGSLKEEFRPGDIIVPHQIIDRTRRREGSFFGEGVVAHVSMANPYCSVLRRSLIACARQATSEKAIQVHDGATYIVMEGPQFSTRAESELYRSWGASIIGMTGMPEAKLAREAEISYATLAFVTDYDCWRNETADVDIPQILAILKQSATTAGDTICALARDLVNAEQPNMIAQSLRDAILTPVSAWPERTKEKLFPILKPYID